MTYMLLSFIAAVVGVSPFLFKKQFVLGAVVSVIPFFTIWWFSYAMAASTVWPLFGFWGIMAIIWMFISSGICATIADSQSRSVDPWGFVAGILLSIVLIGTGFFGWSAFWADEYASFIKPEQRVWTQDVQPKDPKHMRMVSAGNALAQARRQLGQLGAIGSQFELATEYATLQLISGELMYVVPLDYAGFRPWLNADGVPGYIKVYAEDPRKDPELVSFVGQKMIFSPEAWFSKNLERHLRNNGYMSFGLTDFNLEVDDEKGLPWWIVTVYKPTITWYGETVLGVAQVNPMTGDIVFHKYGEVPQWIDRVVPASFVKRYLEWNGLYRKGWLNSWWNKFEITEPEEPRLIYSEGGEPEYVAGITSSNDNDESLIGLVYVNTRTGKSVYYTLKGGSTDVGALRAVNSNSEVQFKHLHGTVPQLYNVSGRPTFVVPLLNDQNLFQGVAMAEVTNVQNLAVGADQYEALRKYERLFGAHGQQVALSNESRRETMRARVVRIAPEVLSTGGVVFNLYVDKDPHHIYTVGSTEYPEVTITLAGDTVQFVFVKSPGMVVPIIDFDNLDLPIWKSPDEEAVGAAAKERERVEDDATRRDTLEDRVKKMSTEELEKLLKPGAR